MKDLRLTNLRDGCRRCKVSDFGIGLYVTEVGQRRLAYYCRACGHRTTMYEPLTDKEAERQVDRVWDLSVRTQCVVCNVNGAQVHHWAPYHLFGQEADLWPTARLCQTCHTRWHNLVTPTMSHQPGVLWQGDRASA